MRRALAFAVAVSALAGCAVDGLDFRADDRVAIVAPDDRAEVALPLVVEWDATGLDPADRRFAVLVDRTPPPPGRAPAWLFRNATDCSGDECASAAYLAERDVFLTTDTSITIEQVPARRSGDRPMHDITVVLLDAAGERSGEAAWTVRVEVDGSEPT